MAETTRRIEIGDKVLPRTGSVFRDCCGQQPAILIADRNTFAAAGKALLHELQVEGQTALEEPLVFEEPNLRAEQRRIERLKERFRTTEAVPIAVGSGTINDLVKLAAFESGRGYLVFATAASMDGYAAYGAPIEIDGFKKTVFAPAPLAVLVDRDVILRSPPRLSAAGYADLLAKIPAGADWLLADALGAEAVDPIGWSMVQEPLRDWIGDPEGIANHDQTALFGLIEGLLMSGLAIQKSKTSRTASGAEHQFSHLWDNEHHLFQGEVPLHGFKVGIGAITTAALYEQVLLLEKSDLLESRRTVVQTRRSWDQTERLIRDSFSGAGLIERVIAESHEKWLDDAALLARFDRTIEVWEELRTKLRRQLLGARLLQEKLRAAGAITEPEEIGIDRVRLRRSIGLAQRIRSRYTVLDFLLETGRFDHCVAPLFAPGGIWEELAQS